MTTTGGDSGNSGGAMPRENQTKSLSDLGLHARGGRETLVRGLAVDSRDVKPGYLFAALPGVNMHGAEFITFALRMGAAAVLTDPAGEKIARDALNSADYRSSVALVVVEEPRAALAFAAALWFGAQPEIMVAATGTNGKTSVATFTRQIWEELGLAAVNLGTTGVEGYYAAPLAHTTPEPVTLHRLLAQMSRAGVTHAAMEASSHGLAQNRLDGVRLSAAAFTNFSQDHLDYHADFDDYFNAKAGLFSRVLAENGTAVINVDDARGADMVALAMARGHRVLTVGRLAGANLRIVNQRFDATGQELLFAWQGKDHHVRLKLIGGFQAENVLAAAALVIGTGVDAAEVFETLPHLTTVRGRMELAATRTNGAPVFVDYSHTPGAVATALKALRPHVMGRIVVIIGAGGDRDTTKRPLMGQAACENADVVFVTDDNPRSEVPGVIRASVMEGCARVAGIAATEVGDRAEAILRGVDALGAADALLICGKGHETGQVVGDQVLPFNDVEQASVAVAALEGRLA